MININSIKDFAFGVGHGFRGAPVVLQGRTFRLDESLRRWKTDGEDGVQRTLCKHLKPGAHFVDVGANFGLHTLLGAGCVGPSGQVASIEPVPANLRLLNRHVALNGFTGRVRVFPVAASDAEGEIEMHGVEDGDVSVAARMGQPGQSGGSIKVRTVPLDECLKGRLKPVDLIKIDVEGAEHLVLRGARQLLATDRPLLLIEVHTFALPSFGSSPESLRKDLEQSGYTEELIDNIDGQGGAYFHALYSPKSESRKS